MKSRIRNTLTLNNNTSLVNMENQSHKNWKFQDTLNDPKNAIWASLLVMLLDGIFVIAPGYLIALILEQTEWTYLTELTISFSVQFICAGLTLLVIVPGILGVPTKLRPFKEYLQSIRLGNYKPLGKIIFIGLTGTIFILFLCIFLPSTTGNLVFQPDQVFGPPVREGSTVGFPALGWFGFIDMLIPGIWEEVIGRGIILTLLLRKYPKEKGDHHKAIALAGFLFGFMHMMNIPNLINDPYFVIGQVIWSTIIGIAWGYVAVGTNSLVPSIFIHWMIDTFSHYITFDGDMMVFMVLFLVAMLIGSGLIIFLVYQTTDIREFDKKNSELGRIQKSIRPFP